MLNAPLGAIFPLGISRSDGMIQGSTRRTVLATGAAALVAGCSDANTDGGSSSPSSAAPSAAGTEAAPAEKPAAPAGEELARTADIPVGGGKVFTEQKVVVTQPKKNEFKAFSAICTHQGCTVSRVANGSIECPCHGSAFRADDGSVSHGPAQQPLEERRISVEGNTIRLT
ncbi:Rieske (2Fe-2S) protein [Streptomyces mexicanus]